MNKKYHAHLLALDFESWIFSDYVNRENLSIKQLRELDNNYTLQSLEEILKILREYRQKITFFVILKLEELYPGILARIQDEGHEIGWHSYTHETLLSLETLEKELHYSKKYIRKYKIRGFQAPKIQFFKEGYDLLKQHGFTYSSSIYGNSRYIYNFDGIFEIPVSTSKESYNPQMERITFPSNMNVKNILSFGIPIGSSYFWSILGKNYYARKLTHAREKNISMNLFIHNWQIVKPRSNSLQFKPKEHKSFLQNPLYYPYTKNVKDIFEYLLLGFKFQTFEEYFSEKKNLFYSCR